jgi:single-stranded DNA-binding protein
MDINHVHLQGCLGDGPKYFPAADGKEAFASFSLATNVKVRAKDAAGASVDTQWHDIACYAWRADLAQHWKKGTRVDLIGYKRRREYATSGGKGYAHEVVALALHEVVVTSAQIPVAATPVSHDLSQYL